jgi:hypothetical protein
LAGISISSGGGIDEDDDGDDAAVDWHRVDGGGCGEEVRRLLGLEDETQPYRQSTLSSRIIHDRKTEPEGEPIMVKFFV